MMFYDSYVSCLSYYNENLVYKKTVILQISMNRMNKVLEQKNRSRSLSNSISILQYIQKVLEFIFENLMENLIIVLIWMTTSSEANCPVVKRLVAKCPF